jgi:WD40 repeat protein
VYATQDGVGLVDVDSGEIVRRLDPIDALAFEVAWSPDGDRIATGNDDGTVRVWDPATGAQVAVGGGDLTEVVGLDWSADGARVASGSNDGTARVWDLDEDSLTELYRFAAQDLSNGVPGVAFSPDGDRLMAADWQITSTKVFDLRPDGAGELGSFRTPPGSSTIGFTNDGTGVVSSVDDGLVGVWDAADGTRRSTIDGVPSPGFVISPDGTLVAAAGPEGFPVTLREMATGREVAEYDVPDAWLETFAWSPDSRHLAVAYGTEPGSVVTVLDLSLEVLATKDRPGFFVPDVAFSADGTRLAIAGSGRDRFDPVEDRAIIWDWQADEVVTTLDEVALQVEFDPTSDRLATLLFNESTFVAFDARTGERLTEFTGHGGLVRDLRYSGDGTVLVSVSDDFTARVWDARTGAQIEVLRTDARLVGVAVDQTGSRVATVDGDGVVRVWTLDLDELIDLAEARLTRGLTDAECQQYLHRDRCAA